MTSRRIARSLSYNEEKIKIGKAECLLAGNYLANSIHLKFEDKFRCLQRRMELNDRVRTSLHITLNFDPSDDLPNPKMRQIAKLYMEEIGFGRQPYLVYRHYDAGHPHCHIVTTHVRSDGKPIDLYNMGRNQSEKARQFLEARFGLVTAEMKRQAWLERQKVDGVPMVRYGEKGLTQAVSNVLEHVMQEYKYASLAEFNAVLRLYRIEAYRGKEGSLLHQHRGLLYRVLDENGKYIGVPIKASFFDCKPTLVNLEKKFVLNQFLKENSFQRISTYVHFALLQEPESLEAMKRRLGQDQIAMVVLRDKSGVCLDVSYVDFRDKGVVSGHDLGFHGNKISIQQVIDHQKALEKERALHPVQEEVHRHRHSLRL